LREQQSKARVEDQEFEIEPEDDNREEESATKWYLIDKDQAFCQCWDFFITLLLIYE